MKIHLDFLARERRRARWVRFSLALTLVALGGLLFWQVWMLQHLQTEYGEMAERLQDLAVRTQKAQAHLQELPPLPDRAGLEATARQVAFVNEFLEQGALSWSRFLLAVEEAVPKGVGLTGIRPSAMAARRNPRPGFTGRKMELTGETRSVKALADFLERLAKAPGIQDVVLLKQGRTQGPGRGNLLTFTLALRYVLEGESVNR